MAALGGDPPVRGFEGLLHPRTTSPFAACETIRNVAEPVSVGLRRTIIYRRREASLDCGSSGRGFEPRHPPHLTFGIAVGCARNCARAPGRETLYSLAKSRAPRASHAPSNTPASGPGSRETRRTGRGRCAAFATGCLLRRLTWRGVASRRANLDSAGLLAERAAMLAAPLSKISTIDSAPLAARPRAPPDSGPSRCPTSR
jgi:hypothetical protein